MSALSLHAEVMHGDCPPEWIRPRRGARELTERPPPSIGLDIRARRRSTSLQPLRAPIAVIYSMHQRPSPAHAAPPEGGDEIIHTALQGESSHLICIWVQRNLRTFSPSSGEVRSTLLQPIALALGSHAQEPRDRMIIDRQTLRRIPLISTAYRAANRRHYNVIRGNPIFAPNSDGDVRVRAALTERATLSFFPALLRFLQASDFPVAPIREADDFPQADPQRVLDASRLFMHHGSDKASTHDYHLVYASILEQLESPRSILEIGLGTNHEDVISNMGSHGRPGASLRAFRDLAPTAHIYGADVDRRILFEEDRIRTHHVDQTDIESLSNLLAWLPDHLDLIIDDGLHSPDANINILWLASQCLRRGGWVVIEDITPEASALWQCVTAVLDRDYRTYLLKMRGGLMLAAQRR